jgi:hypothetical protein
MFHVAEQIVDVFAGYAQAPLLSLIQFPRLPRFSRFWL